MILATALAAALAQHVTASPVSPGEELAPFDALGADRDARWRFAGRWIPGADEARTQLHTALGYVVTPELTAGIDFVPNGGDVGVVAQWLALPEAHGRPAVTIGTGPDRLGTPRGRALWAVFSKDLEPATSLAITPWLGAAFGTFDDEITEVAGLRVRWSDDWTSTHTWDGAGLHHLVETTFDDTYVVGLLLARVDDGFELGITLRFGFDFDVEHTFGGL